MHKFQTLNIAQRTTHPIIADEQMIPYTNKATALGLTFSTRSITPQITTRRAMAMRTLNRLEKVPKPIHKQQKKTVQNNYTPTATLPNHSTKHYFTLIIQKTTTGTKQSPKIHRIHRRAIDAWTQLHDKNPDLYDTLKPEADELTRHTHFPTSFLTAETPESRPIYV